MEGRQPEYADVFSTRRKHKKVGKRDVIDYLVCNDLATLLYIINLGCIDENPWTSRVSNFLHPDFIVIDLDPSDRDFRKGIEAALAAKEVFDKHKLKVQKLLVRPAFTCLSPAKKLHFPKHGKLPKGFVTTSMILYRTLQRQQLKLTEEVKNYT